MLTVIWPPGQVERAGRFLVALAAEPDTEVEVTFPEASDLLDVYRQRYAFHGESAKHYGWCEFLSALEVEDGAVGLLSVRAAGMSAIVLVDKQLECVLAALLR
ncbi:hypothetical protein CAG99_10270 [Streptomyces marincola]|uniref:Uncharacterized protein n=2 Tax=Streptomyces marincola TaxID=2878388 RepID=A0A1W7CWT2_9ACTN|nr:hypothetical protein CAG99_10270 [Streptomyces marincola]